jgi:hypothetical protein
MQTMHHQAHHANQHVPLLLFARPVSKHSIYSTEKKNAFERKFRMCEMVVHVVEMACVFTDCSTTTTNQHSTTGWPNRTLNTASCTVPEKHQDD